MTGEANFTDENILAENNLSMEKTNTVALLISIRMTMAVMIRYLN